MRDLVWIERGQYAVYFQSETNQTGWKHVQTHRPEWRKGYLELGTKSFEEDAEQFDKFVAEKLDVAVPVLVHKTRMGALYARI